MNEVEPRLLLALNHFIGLLNEQGEVLSLIQQKISELGASPSPVKPVEEKRDASDYLSRLIQNNIVLEGRVMQSRDILNQLQSLV